MSQSAYTPISGETSGSELVAALNASLPALYSSSSGTTAPPSPVIGQVWLDTSNGALFAFKVLTATGPSVWATIATIVPSTGVVSTAGGGGGGGGGATSGISLNVTLPSGHGLAVGKAVYFNGSSWQKARANSALTTAQAIVTALSGNDAELTVAGIRSVFSGLIPGASYKLSQTTAGDITTNVSNGAGAVVQPCLIALSDTTAIVFVESAVSAASSSTGGSVRLLPSTTADNTIISPSAGVTPLTLRQAAGQSAPLLRLEDQSGNLLQSFPLTIGGGGSGGTVGSTIPVGVMLPYFGAVAPTGWLLCNGTAIPNGYVQLIAIVGANTPNMLGRTVFGAGANGVTLKNSVGSPTKQLITANLPAHSHVVAGTQETGSGGVTSKPPANGVGGNANITTSQTGSGAAFDVMNPGFGVNFIIKHD